MEDQRKTNTRSRKRKWRNANTRIAPAASKRIREFISELEGSDDFSLNYLKSEYLSKYCDESVTPAEERANRAIDKWLLTEEKNKVTNQVLSERDPGYNILPRVTWSSFVLFARRMIADILGPLTDKTVLGSYSGGASTSCRRTESSPAHKFAGQADTTAEAAAYIDIIYREAPLLRQFGVFNSFREVEGAELFTVPKKTDIDRCACKEPDVNMYLQKGVGRHIRSRLRRFGQNLNDQSVNRKLAQKGAADGSLATLDLSSASDTISLECVRTLLPEDWFLYLNDIRSRSVKVRGVYYRTEMFSSMGNGFTFELESLIFLALTRTCLYFEGIPGIVSIYGDDIICPSKGAEMVSWVLHSFGFEVNMKKSHFTGPFRESCGGHYHGLDDVTPFYLKREATHLTDVIRVANQFRLWALTDPGRQYALPSTYKVWTQLAELVPPSLWGGRDYASDTQLVSPHAPNLRLSRLSGKRKEPEKGRYLHWHNSTWKRAQGPDDESKVPVDTETKLCRLVKARNGAPYCELMFHQELGLQVGPG